MVVKHFCDGCGVEMGPYKTGCIKVSIEGLHRGDWSEQISFECCSKKCVIDKLNKLNG